MWWFCILEIPHIFSSLGTSWVRLGWCICLVELNMRRYPTQLKQKTPFRRHLPRARLRVAGAEACLQSTVGSLVHRSCDSYVCCFPSYTCKRFTIILSCFALFFPTSRTIISFYGLWQLFVVIWGMVYYQFNITYNYHSRRIIFYLILTYNQQQ